MTGTAPIAISRQYWENSQLSLVRHTGQIRFHGKAYTIVNKYGLTAFQTTIHDNEPADLVRNDFIPYYRKLGRDKFVEVLNRHRTTVDTELHQIFKDLTKPAKQQQQDNKQTSLDL